MKLGIRLSVSLFISYPWDERMPIDEHEWESLEYEHIPLLEALENQLREGFPQAYTLEELANELRIVEEVDAEPDLFLRTELYVYLDILVDAGRIESKDTREYVGQPTTYYRTKDSAET